MSEAPFWHDIYGWSLALGFILTVILITVISIKNPFGPFIRWIDKWQEHRMNMAKIKLRGRLTRDIDPDYVKFLEEKTRKEERRP